MKTVEKDQGAPDLGQRRQRGFRTARRRRMILSIVSVGSVMAVCVVALAIVEVARPLRDLDAVQTALPEGELTAEHVLAAAIGLQRILEDSPGHDAVLEYSIGIQQRVAEQVRAHLERGELDRANEILTAASGFWPDSEWVGGTSELRAELNAALEQRQAREEDSERIDNAAAVLAGDWADIEGIGAALRLLRQVLGRNPGDERAQTLLDSARGNLLEAIRLELDAENPDRAEEFLNLTRNEWAGDDAIAQLREELSNLRDKLARVAEAIRLIELGEQRLAAGNPNMSPCESAADLFHQALERDPGNERAGAGLARVADSCVVSIRAAVALRDDVEARRLLATLIGVAPAHPMIPALEEAIGKLENPPPPPLVDVDDETRMYFEVKDNCDLINRYLYAYPGGRYRDEAQRFYRSCRETR